MPLLPLQTLLSPGSLTFSLPLSLHSCQFYLIILIDLSSLHFSLIVIQIPQPRYTILKTDLKHQFLIFEFEYRTKSCQKPDTE